MWAGLSRVPVSIFGSRDELDILEALVHSNRQRAKGNEQIARECETLFYVETERAKRRQATSAAGIYGGQPLGVMLPEAVDDIGRARDKVGATVGWGGSKGERGARALPAGAGGAGCPGRATIRASVREGTYSEALERGATANATNAVQLTPRERRRGVVRLFDLHHEADRARWKDGWSVERVARQMACSMPTVWRILAEDRPQRSSINARTSDEDHWPPLYPVDPDVPEEIQQAAQAAPVEYRDQLQGTALAEGWSAAEVQTAAAGLADPSVRGCPVCARSPRTGAITDAQGADRAAQVPGPTGPPKAPPGPAQAAEDALSGEKCQVGGPGLDRVW
jgi:hypothetical protein